MNSNDHLKFSIKNHEDDNHVIGQNVILVSTARVNVFQS
jgi:hypothetical protein